MVHSQNMEHNFCVTNQESQNFVSATTWQFGIRVILVLSKESITNKSCVLGVSDSTVTISEQGQSSGNWTAKVHSLEGYDELMTYSDTGIENALLSTRVFSYSDQLPIGVFSVSLPPFVPNQEKAVLSYIANVLRKYGHFATIIISDGSSRDSKTFTEDL